MTSTDFLARRATMDDAPQLMHLSDSLGYVTDERAIANRLSQFCVRDDHAVLVAETGSGEIVGWIHAFAALRVTTETFIEIGGLVVHENARRRGVGSRLIAEVRRWATEIGIARLRVRVNQTREGAHHFYGRLGFEVVKQQNVLELHTGSGDQESYH